MKTIFLLLTSILLLNACNSSGISNAKYRNADYVWFVADNHTEGEWIKIENDKTKTILKNGHCTEFYKSGGIREEYTLDNQGKSDTTFYYNLQGERSHYSIKKGKKITNHFLKNGYFEAYTANEEIIVKGAVKDNQLAQFNFEGDFKTFQTLNASSTKVWFLTNKVVQSITRASALRQKNNELTIPQNTLEEIENLRIKTIKYTKAQIEKLNNFTVKRNLEPLKKATINFDELNKKLLENEFNDLIQAMQNEFTEDNLKTMTSISVQILSITQKADKTLQQEQINFSREIKAADYLVPLSERKKQELLNL